jgi:hypothetical protein
MSNKVDDVAPDAAAATVPKPLLDVVCEAIVPAANQTRSDKIAALSSALATATSDFIVDVYGAREFDCGGGN